MNLKLTFQQKYDPNVYVHTMLYQHNVMLT